MGMRAYGTVSINVNWVFEFADRFGLPKPECEDGICTMTSRQVRRYLDFDVPMLTDSYFRAWIIMTAVMTSDAQTYMTKVVEEADGLQRDGKLAKEDRKNFFRKKSKEYRLLFA